MIPIHRASKNGIGSLMNKALMALTGVGVGAGLMYILDPDRGRRRRALARDKAASTWNRSEKYLGKMSHDLANRSRGLAHDAKAALAGERREPGDGTGRPHGGENWSPATRILASALGGGLAIYGYRRRGLVGKTATALGMGLLTRGVTNQGMPMLRTGPLGRIGDKIAASVGSGIESVAGKAFDGRTEPHKTEAPTRGNGTSGAHEALSRLTPTRSPGA
jgi:hypothetical protein